MKRSERLAPDRILRGPGRPTKVIVEPTADHHDADELRMAIEHATFDGVGYWRPTVDHDAITLAIEQYQRRRM